MDQTAKFEAERPRLLRLATRLLSDAIEAQDVVQQSWLRLHGSDAQIENLAGWLTTVTSRLCLDRLRAPAVITQPDPQILGNAPDPADDVILADAIGVALHVVLQRLSPKQRVAFVLHDSFGFEFETIAGILQTTPQAARKLASRARSKIAQPNPGNRLADWEVVDAFLTAARAGDFSRLLELLAPEAVIAGDTAAIAAGTPTEISGQQEVATFFNGSAAAALPVFIGDLPGAAWFHQGQARVAFDFTVADGVVRRIDFRADPAVLAQISRRYGKSRRD